MAVSVRWRHESEKRLRAFYVEAVKCVYWSAGSENGNSGMYFERIIASYRRVTVTKVLLIAWLISLPVALVAFAYVNRALWSLPIDPLAGEVFEPRTVRQVDSAELGVPIAANLFNLLVWAMLSVYRQRIWKGRAVTFLLSAIPLLGIVNIPPRFTEESLAGMLTTLLAGLGWVVGPVVCIYLPTTHYQLSKHPSKLLETRNRPARIVSPAALVSLMALSLLTLSVLARWHWSHFRIDQSNSTFSASKTETVYRNPGYGVTLHLPGAWESAPEIESSPSHFCDLQSSFITVSFWPVHVNPIRSLDTYAGTFVSEIVADSPYVAENPVDIEVNGARAKKLVFHRRGAMGGAALTLVLVKRHSTLYVLSVFYLTFAPSAEEQRAQQELLNHLSRALDIT